MFAVDPLPDTSIAYFALDNVQYHGANVSIAWDPTGQQHVSTTRCLAAQPPTTNAQRISLPPNHRCRRRHRRHCGDEPQLHASTHLLWAGAASASEARQNQKLQLDLGFRSPASVLAIVAHVWHRGRVRQAVQGQGVLGPVCLGQRQARRHLAHPSAAQRHPAAVKIGRRWDRLLKPRSCTRCRGHPRWLAPDERLGARCTLAPRTRNLIRMPQTHRFASCALIQSEAEVEGSEAVVFVKLLVRGGCSILWFSGRSTQSQRAVLTVLLLLCTGWRWWWHAGPTLASQGQGSSASRPGRAGPSSSSPATSTLPSKCNSVTAYPHPTPCAVCTCNQRLATCVCVCVCVCVWVCGCVCVCVCVCVCAETSQSPKEADTSEPAVPCMVLHGTAAG